MSEDDILQDSLVDDVEYDAIDNNETTEDIQEYIEDVETMEADEEIRKEDEIAEDILDSDAMEERIAEVELDPEEDYNGLLEEHDDI